MNIFYELILFIDIATAFMLYGPESQVAFVGNPAAMSCGSDDIEIFSRWYFLGFKPTDVLIYNTKYTKPGFNVIITEQRIHTLKIENVTSDDAGIYRCLLRKFESGGTRTVAEYKADLIVFESHPVCALNKSGERSDIVAGDMVVLFCSVVYYGNWVPVMEWSRNDGKSTETEIIKTPNDKIITSTAKILAEPEDNGVTFSCTMAFQSSVLSRNITRPPNYDLIWNYTLNVLYLIRNIEIEPKSASYSPNDQLYCLAIGNPTPSCKWTDAETNEVLSLHCHLILDENVTVDRLHTFQCTAENPVANISNTTSIRVIFRPTERRIVYHVTIGLGIVCLCIAIPAIYIGRNYINDGYHFLNDCICQRNSIQDEIIEQEAVSEVQTEYNLADENVLPMGNDGNGIHNRPNKYYGSDGTEYMEMNEVCAECSSKVSIIHPSIYESITYAKIDHSMTPKELQKDTA